MRTYACIGASSLAAGRQKSRKMYTFRAAFRENEMFVCANNALFASADLFVGTTLPQKNYCLRNFANFNRENENTDNISFNTQLSPFLHDPDRWIYVNLKIVSRRDKSRTHLSGDITTRR